MAREVDPKRVKKALSRVRRLVAEAQAASPERGLSDWETEFAESLETRLLAYGSAFADPEKGALDQPLSVRQGRKLREISAKTRTPTPADGGASDAETEVRTARPPRAPGEREAKARRRGFGRRQPIGPGPRVRHVEAE